MTSRSAPTCSTRWSIGWPPADGVIGARLTGAGFGGCVVALVDRGTPLPDDLTAWRVIPSEGARIVDEDDTGPQ